jgi:hypothetical protein
MARSILSEDQKIYGYYGIKGDRFTEVAGWEKGTAGFAGNIYSKLASENGIQPVDPAITGSREPFKVGRFLIKILKTVPFFDKKAMYAWRYIIEDTAVSLDGIANGQIDSIDRVHGAVRQTSYYGGIYKEANGEFTVTVPETAGQLVRKARDYWLGGLSDPKTGVAHFYGKDVRDLQPNKSMTILYVLLGPTCRPDDIEYACIWHDAMIYENQHNHNNSGTFGEAGTGAEHPLAFKGTFDRGPQVDLLASVIVDREGLYEERSWNAVLPQYVYDEYLSAKGPAKEDYNITIANRIEQEMGLSGEPGKAYSNGDSYNQIKDANPDIYADGVPNGNVLNSLLSQGGTASPHSAMELN